MGRSWSKKLFGFCGTLTLFFGNASASAVDPSMPLTNLRGQSWVLENGLPQDTVHALAQTVQGYIWVGTEGGLARFDGRDFQIFGRGSVGALPSDDINCLLATRDGDLWIGTGRGLARWEKGSITAFSERDGLPSNEIRTLVQTGDGTVWVWTGGGLARLNNGHFEIAVDGLPPGKITAVFTGGEDALWVMTTQGLEAYKNGNSKEIAGRPSWPQGGAFLAQQLPDGTLALAGNRDLVLTSGERILQRLTVGKELPGARIQSLLADRKGALWIGTNKGLARFFSGKLQLFPAGDPLATASVLALLEDREGNLWVGTESTGLHILRDRRFFTIGTQEGLASDKTTTVVEDRTGTLWVGTSGSGLNALPLSGSAPDSGILSRPGAIRTYTTRRGLASNVILSLAAAPSGDVWVGTPDGLNQIRGDRINTYTSADGLPDDFIRSLLVDENGSLWIGTRRGLAHRTQQANGRTQIKIYTQADGLGSDLVGAMARDARGDLWVATLAGLSRLRNDRITNFTTADALSSDIATALFPRSDGSLLIGTENHGLDLWDGQRFSAVLQSGLDRITVHAILNDGIGHHWFATGSGIARCNEAAKADPAADCSHWVEFGTADGLRSPQMAANSHPSAWRSREGHLWFATARGLVEVDPVRFPLNTLPPPVVLERFAVDNEDQRVDDAGASLSVAAGHVDFEFDYAGLSFIAPQEVRYRYMLQGFDRGWTDAGTRRAAYYTNIPPGHYIFRVEAANNDGLWNTTGTQLSFDLQRHFYRTSWFYCLMLAAMVGSIILLLRLRLRVAKGEFRAVLRERGRIAREIHDTLAQGYVGVSVQLELLAELLRRKKLDDAARQLDTTREYVREGLADARQSIWALRTQDSGDENLPLRLRSMVNRAADADLESRFSVFGAFRPLPAATERELLRIAQEAIHNVKKHAAAHELLVRLEYGQEMIVLEVRDDGRGGAVAQKHGLAAGNFGITGMQERVEALGGTLEIQSAPGMGTTISLRVPASAQAQERERALP
jgi:ligand-binding sensor domain-containing protein/signal transduction histidine kinase